MTLCSNPTLSIPSREDLDQFVHQAVDNWQRCNLSPAMKTLGEFAEKLTVNPASCSNREISRLRRLGLSDRAIHDAVQVISYFNYINRIADGLGVDAEKGMKNWGRKRSLFRDKRGVYLSVKPKPREQK